MFRSFPRSAAVPRRAVVALACALALSGCGSGGSGATPATPTATGTGAGAGEQGTFPVTVPLGAPSAGSTPATLTLAARPTRIVSLAPSLTETLFAVGAGPQVASVDQLSNFPSQAPRSALSSMQPNAEAIAAQRPDLVLLSGDSNGVVAALTRLRIPVAVLSAPATLDAAYAQIETVGTLTGQVGAARAVAAEVRRRVDAAAASVPRTATPLRVYHELDQTYYSVTSSTFIGSVYRRLGLANIADAAPGAAGGYPQLSAEYVVSASPDLIVLADSKCCGQSATTVAARPGFAAVAAVRSGRVLAVDDDIASRWGPRIADLAEKIAAALAAGRS